MVVAEVNPEAIAGHRGIIAKLDWAAMRALPVLKPIHMRRASNGSC